MNSGIYKIINNQTGRFYIGSAFNTEQRWQRHLRQLEQNKHFNYNLQEEWSAYGKQNFTFIVLENCSPDNILQREQHYLNKYFDNQTICYNICSFAGNSANRKIKEETRTKLSVARRGSKNINFGKPRTQEVKNKISKSKIGRKPWNKGVACSEEIKNKIRLAKLCQKATEATKAKLSAAKQGSKNNSAMLNEKEVIEIRKSVNDAKTLAKQFNVSISTIYRIIKKKVWKHI